MPNSQQTEDNSKSKKILEKVSDLCVSDTFEEGQNSLGVLFAVRSNRIEF